MQNIASTAAVIFAIAGLVVAVVHEIQWRRRLKNWSKTEGTVIGEVDKEDYVHAEIEYVHKDRKTTFVSKYGGGGCKVCKTVIVVYDPVSGAAEQLSWSNRWLFTLALPVFSAVFLWAGLSTWN